MSMTQDELNAQLLHQLKMIEDPDYKARFIHQAATARMQPGEDYYPYLPDAVSEALGNLQPEQYRMLADKMAVAGSDLTCIRSFVQDYWYRMTIALVEREVGL
jgi:hypothetical protein